MTYDCALDIVEHIFVQKSQIEKFCEKIFRESQNEYYFQLFMKEVMIPETLIHNSKGINT